MGLITEEVEVILHGKNIMYFELLGYPIPRTKKKQGKIGVKRGTKIKVKVEDLMDKCSIPVDVKCDNCEEILMNIPWCNYKRYEKNNKYYCHKCSIKLYGAKSTNNTKLKNSKSFEQWCIDNNRQDVLDRWDYELNKCNPSEITYCSTGFGSKGYWFRCTKNFNHKSELKNIASFTHGHLGSIQCNQCKSFEQWCIENNRQDILNLWDYSLNNCKPNEISSGIHKKYYFRCPKGIHKSELKNIKSFTSNLCTIKCDSCNSIAQYISDVCGFNFIDKYLNKNINYWKIDKFSNKQIYWKCLNHKHEDYLRNPYDAIKFNFRCPECSRERTESLLQEKVRLHLESLNYTILHEYNCTIIPKNSKKIHCNNRMPFDNEIKELNLIIEVHGEQHYIITGLTKLTSHNNNTTPEYELHMQKVRDRYKRIYAKSKGYNYLEIPYWTDDKEETWKQLINNKINEILHNNSLDNVI